MTKVLKLGLLGPLQLSYDGRPLAELGSAKAQALLCYLAVTGRAHSRQALAGLLWGDLPEADARRNLRGVVMQLRQAVEPFLDINHQTLAFKREAPYWLDVEQFAAVERSDMPRGVTTLRQAAELYRGDFLDDFYVRQAPAFETWLQQQRTACQERAVAVFTALAEAMESEGDLVQAILSARQLVALEPTRESSQRQLARMLALSGQRSAALSQLEQCRLLLHTELGVDPAPETVALAEQIRSGQVSELAADRPLAAANRPRPPAPRRPATDGHAFIAGPPINHPAHFFGREREVRRIFGLLRRQPLQNAAIVGPRRSGKTSLLHYLKTITASRPDQLRPGQRRDWLPAPGNFCWAFVDFQDSRMGSRDGLLRYLLQQMNLPTPDQCELTDFLDIVTDHLATPTVILFDEIGVAMSRYSELDDPFWEGLRALATNLVDGRLAFILASHEAPERLAQSRGLGSPFFNIFGYTTVLGPLDEAAARALIASSPLPFTAADVAWILAESGRWPMPLQILCRERLVALEEGDGGDLWREDGRRQIAPFKPAA